MNDSRTPDDAAAAERGRAWWHSRRGLRELDLLLLPFVENCWEQLDAAERALYRRLLDNEDAELLVWFTGRGVCLDGEVQALVERIRAHHAAPV